MTRSIARRGFTLIEMLVVIAIIGVLIGLLMPAVQKVRGAANRAKCQNNLHQIGLASFNYHGMYSSFPPGLTTTTPYYQSWMVRLLPFIEQDNLWRTSVQAWQTNSYPWDNPPHVGVATVIQCYICPQDYREMTANWGEGYFVAFTGYLGVEGVDQNNRNGVLSANNTVSIGDIKDGTSNTLYCGERPPNLTYWFGWWYAGAGMDSLGTGDLLLGVNGYNTYEGTCPPGPYQFSEGSATDECSMYHFWSMHNEGANFLFCDGSVRFLGYSAAAPVMRSLATIAGGEVIPSY